MKILKNMGLILCAALFLSGCSASLNAQPVSEKQESTASAPKFTYEKNGAPLTYDEMTKWANDLAPLMAEEERDSTTEQEDGTVLADYGHAEILWSGWNAPKICRLEIKEPNLACPRGVFLGNPSEKVEAYYQSQNNPSYNEEEKLIYLEEKKNDDTGKWETNYGFYGDGRVNYGAISKRYDGTYTSLELQFAIAEDKVSHITYLAAYELTEEEAMERKALVDAIG